MHTFSTFRIRMGKHDVWLEAQEARLADKVASCKDVP